MIETTLGKIADHLGVELSGAARNIVISNVETDSRKDVKGALFVALSGDNFDGHKFIPEVVRKGAAAVIASHMVDTDVPVLVVKDTLSALGYIGQLNRRMSHAFVVSITGTCGKTSVKEMTAAILSRMGKVTATKGNFNNSVGVPLTLLSIEKDTDFAVVELGASHPDDINFTVKFAEPNAAVINNVGGAHLEGFGSMDGVYHAKSELLDFVFAHNGKGAVNADNEYYPRWKKDYAGKDLHSFGMNNPEAEFRASDLKPGKDGTFSFVLSSPEGKCEINLSIPGRHNVLNAASAAVLTSFAGAKLADISAGISSVKPVRGRLFIEHLGDLTLIDDAYNASFNAVLASIDTLSLLPGYKVFVFGGMGELGTTSDELHKKVGVYACGKVDEFIALGKDAAISAAAADGITFDSKEKLLDYVGNLVRTNPKLTITAKGSHSSKMGDVVDYIKNIKN